MKIKTIYKFLFAGWLLLAMPACIEDKGNYDIQEINGVTIQGISGYLVYLGGPLSITPTLTFSQGEDPESFEYEWHLTASTLSVENRGTLSTERNLNITIGGQGSPINRDGTYYAIYKVTNIKTGVVYYSDIFQISVRNRTETGYIMLNETGENSFDIDLISVFMDTLTQSHRVLEAFGSELPHTSAKPLGLVCHGDIYSPSLQDTLPGGKSSKRYAIWVLSDKLTARVRIEDFHYEPEYNVSSMFLNPPTENIAAQMMSSVSQHSNAMYRDYLYYNGNWYFYNYGGAIMFYYKPINAASSVSEPYKTPPCIYHTHDVGAVIFNETANRFEYHKSSNRELSGTLQNLLKTERMEPGQYFDWENPDYQVITMGNRNVTDGFAVVYNRQSQKYELLTMWINSITSPVPLQLGRVEFPADFDVSAIKDFAYSPSLPYIYCSTEDKLYRVHVSSKLTVEDITAQAVPDGHKISLVKACAYRFPRSGLIAVATYDPSGQVGNNAQLAFYGVTALNGNLTLAKHPAAPTSAGYQIDMKWTGFGKVICLDYKSPS
ncbi:MAG: hypothetical protein LBR64_01130 [Dysgonamonadaceae bacterium]|jgi:hypothetical protein|nr:hypothetical protein [Dysgonamonadaceae bacterium]